MRLVGVQTLFGSRRYGVSKTRIGPLNASTVSSTPRGRPRSLPVTIDSAWIGGKSDA